MTHPHSKQQVSTNTLWESRVGYSRLIRIGRHAWSAGTLASDENGDIAHPNSPFQQTLFALEKLERALTEVGMSRNDVVRTRLYVLHINQQEDIGRAHAEFFRDVRPTATMIEVKGLASPFALVEVEIEAYDAS